LYIFTKLLYFLSIRANFCFLFKQNHIYLFQNIGSGATLRSFCFAKQGGKILSSPNGTRIFSSKKQGGIMDFVGTVWALLPPVIAIVLALITKEVYMSLFIGVVTGALLYTNFSPVGTIEAIFEVMMEKLGDSCHIYTGSD
jgi:hypothetical protein